jgi:hypothetical protein
MELYIHSPIHYLGMMMNYTEGQLKQIYTNSIQVPTKFCVKIWWITGSVCGGKKQDIEAWLEISPHKLLRCLAQKEEKHFSAGICVQSRKTHYVLLILNNEELANGARWRMKTLSQCSPTFCYIRAHLTDGCRGAWAVWRLQ